MSEAPGVTLSDAELIHLTGFRQAGKQLAELHKQGFWRARRSIMGGVILEREHYTAVCRGADAKPSAKPRRPQLRMPA